MNIQIHIKNNSLVENVHNCFKYTNGSISNGMQENIHHPVK